MAEATSSETDLKQSTAPSASRGADESDLADEERPQMKADMNTLFILDLVRSRYLIVADI